MRVYASISLETKTTHKISCKRVYSVFESTCT